MFRILDPIATRAHIPAAFGRGEGVSCPVTAEGSVDNHPLIGEMTAGAGGRREVCGRLSPLGRIGVEGGDIFRDVRAGEEP
jgi:hypothetical protein